MSGPGLSRPRGWMAGLLVLILQGSCIAAVAQRPAPQLAKPSPAPSPPARKPLFETRFELTGAKVQGGTVIGTAPIGTSLLTLDGVAVPVAPDGQFLIAFDRDAPTAALLVATLANGQIVSETLPVARRAWNLERLDTLPRIAQPTEEFNRLRPAELAQINAARQRSAESTGWRQPFLWPVIGRISGMFGAQRIYKNGEAGSYHSGTDIAQPNGTAVIAPADGVVILAADHPFTLEGNLLMIDHGMGLNSAFLHLSRIDVQVGQRIQRGQRIGAVGMTGRATGPHLHWSLKWREARVDPSLMAGPMPVG